MKSLTYALVIIGLFNEFNFIGADDVVETCDPDTALRCDNGGICKYGEKVYSDVVIPADLLDHAPAFEMKTDEGMYCDCSEDSETTLFNTGIYCDTKAERCSDGHVCLNGAPCRTGFDGKGHCDCSETTAFGDFTGLSCEYEATDYCDEENEIDDGFDFNDGQWYCANDGECKTGEMDPRKKCTCSSGFYGLHCGLTREISCNRACENGGVCKNGVKNYKYLPPAMEKLYGEVDEMGDHCVCPKGWTGLHCEEKIDECGSGHCFNGSECAQGVTENGDEFTYCNCDREDNSIPSTPFAGMYCENPSSTYCPYPSGFNPLQYYCTNGGGCPDLPHHPCKCDSMHGGPRCEFEKENIQICTLQCENEGLCFFGDEPTDTPYNDLDKNGVLVPSNPNDNMHCKCPDGYTGEFCEKRINICGKDEHMCLHGAPCVNNGLEFECDCEAASTDTMTFVGRSCEFAATSFCQGDHAGKHSFCANHGRCTGTVDREGMHPGCDCEEGFHGDYCEIKGDHNETNGIAGRAFLGFTLSLFGLVLVVGAVIIRERIGKDNLRMKSVGGDNTFVIPEIQCYPRNLDDKDNTMDMKDDDDLSYNDDDDDLSYIEDAKSINLI